MNGLDNIKNKITQDAQAQVDEILSKAKAEAEGIIAAAKKDAGKAEAELKEKGSQQAALAKAGILSNANLEHRKKLLAVKQEIISECFDKAEEELSGKIPQEELKLRIREIKDKLLPELAEILFG